ncbi:MAG: hypothetical protein AAGE61_19465 [Pseudomonadota bacterium]
MMVNPASAQKLAWNMQSFLNQFKKPGRGDPSANPVSGMFADPTTQSVTISVFSPNVLSFMAGPMASIVGRGETIRSVTGWGPNGRAAIDVMLPGVIAADLSEGETYGAISLAPGGGTLPLAGHWQGSGSRQGVPIGKFTQVIAGKLQGSVTIEKIEGDRVIGRFSVSGKGKVGRRTTKVYETKNELGIGLVDKIDWEETTSDVPVGVFGRFKTPSVVDGIKRFQNGMFVSVKAQTQQ